MKIVTAYDKKAELLQVHIIDNGRGIDGQDKSKLFQMFGKLRRTAELNNQGIGMGLMICKKLVELNKGTISVKSDGIDRGSTFTFTMNMMLVSKNTRKVQKSSGKDKLIVDEEQIELEISEDFLIDNNDSEYDEE